MIKGEYQLFIPGPIELSGEVLEELAAPMMPHFGTEWAELYKETTALAKQMFQTEGELYIVPGSGSAALDMGIGNLVYGNKSVLVVSNGFFGNRLFEMAQGFSPNVELLDFGFAQAVDCQRVKAALAKKHYDVLMAVQVETSIGILNPIETLASLTRDSGTVFFVDGVSSIGVERMLMDRWGVDVCASASQKGLESPPGLGLLAFNAKAWSLMETTSRPDWYLNLKVWKRYEPYWGPTHPQLVTHAVPIVRAMTVALKQMLKDGYERHIDSYATITKYFRTELERQGFQLYIKDGYAHGLTAVTIPGGKAGELVEYFKQQHRILIGGGLGPSKGLVVRIGHMGSVADRKHLDKILSIFAEAKSSVPL
ncbi:pyridoxal-phosphate-dependent aminotransferase family protein [Sediminispirochaeta smaragdinae]|jgi:aspartate aminotransferase-like enzyme|uniref:Aminotransferase class V n=1 Tax=Sediminispirochaeta smaragdinae (strain DSM 11293 / JCM 15392 / SEBR 4228) TaxID=573413 RepID=E1RCH5_SEDSS|nr:aminotransferase class V-fold PLP-dependent enzyme [Sediminispirochaeta smaragdinae]ADK80055.1 aminotransferase class V [Sediminispirochaeta smaragdinae DSM 11293]